MGYEEGRVEGRTRLREGGGRYKTGREEDRDGRGENDRDEKDATNDDAILIHCIELTSEEGRKRIKSVRGA